MGRAFCKGTLRGPSFGRRGCDGLVSIPLTSVSPCRVDGRSRTEGAEFGIRIATALLLRYVLSLLYGDAFEGYAWFM